MVFRNRFTLAAVSILLAGTPALASNAGKTGNGGARQARVVYAQDKDGHGQQQGQQKQGQQNRGEHGRVQGGQNRNHGQERGGERNRNYGGERDNRYYRGDHDRGEHDDSDFLWGLLGPSFGFSYNNAPYYGAPYYGAPYNAPYYGYGGGYLDQAYQDGFNVGRADFARGFRFDPWQHDANADPNYRNAFEQGYRAGYSPY